MTRKREHYLTYARVTRVLDGDTFFVECGPLGFRVRVADCNAPERGQPAWSAATDFTQERVLGKWVGLGSRNQQWDRYGRRLSEVWFGKDYERNLSDELQAAGLAVPNPTTLADLMPDSHPMLEHLRPQ
jgi:endonuclease YncB( thermonuclease family)